MTPTVGIQMIFVLGTWFLTRRLLRWDFNIIAACAWTWVSNVLTLLPLYYLFYQTGQVMLGRFDDLMGYDGFASGGFDDIGTIFSQWGVPLILGSLPWMLLSAWGGYYIGLIYARRRLSLRQLRRAPKLPRGTAPVRS